MAEKIKINISAEDITNAKTYLTDICSVGINMDDLNVALDDMQYQGFDPALFMQCLFAFGREGGMTVPEVKKALNTLAVLGTMRGSKVEKIQAKSTKTLSDWLAKMVQTFRITGSKPKTPYDVTLIRIAACHASSLALAMKSGAKIQTTVSPDSLHPKCPTFFCLSTFGSLIPNQDLEPEAQNDLAGAFCWHQVKFDRIINATKKSFTPKDVIIKYFEVQNNSMLYDNATRLQLCNSLGLIKKKGATQYVIADTYSDAMKEMAASFAKMN